MVYCYCICLFFFLAGRCQDVCEFREVDDLVAGCYPPPYYIRCLSADSSVVEQCDDGERLDEVLQRCVLPTTAFGMTGMTTDMMVTDLSDLDDEDDGEYPAYF